MLAVRVDCCTGSISEHCDVFLEVIVRHLQYSIAGFLKHLHSCYICLLLYRYQYSMIMVTPLLRCVQGRLALMQTRVNTIRLCRNFSESDFATQEPFHPIPGREPRWATAQEAVSIIRSSQCRLYTQLQFLCFFSFILMEQENITAVPLQMSRCSTQHSSPPVQFLQNDRKPAAMTDSRRS